MSRGSHTVEEHAQGKAGSYGLSARLLVQESVQGERKSHNLGPLADPHVPRASQTVLLESESVQGEARIPVKEIDAGERRVSRTGDLAGISGRTGVGLSEEQEVYG